MSGERGDARKRGLAVVPCCDAATAVARVRELADLLLEQGEHHVPGCMGQADCAACTYADLRAALDGPADGGAA